MLSLLLASMTAPGYLLDAAWMADVFSGNRQHHVDVVAGGVRVRADLVRGIDQPLRVLAPDTWQIDQQIHCDAKAAFGTWTDANSGGDRGVTRNFRLQLLT